MLPYSKKLKFGEYGSVPKVLNKGYVKTQEKEDRMGGESEKANPAM